MHIQASTTPPLGLWGEDVLGFFDCYTVLLRNEFWSLPSWPEVMEINLVQRIYNKASARLLMLKT